MMISRVATNQWHPHMMKILRHLARQCRHLRCHRLQVQVQVDLGQAAMGRRFQFHLLVARMTRKCRQGDLEAKGMEIGGKFISQELGELNSARATSRSMRIVHMQIITALQAIAKWTGK